MLYDADDTDDTDDDYVLETLYAAVCRAQNQLLFRPLYVVATRQGYMIIDEFPEGEPACYRVNVDKSITFIVTDQETMKLMELPPRAASETTLPMTDVVFGGIILL